MKIHRFAALAFACAAPVVVQSVAQADAVANFTELHLTVENGMSRYYNDIKIQANGDVVVKPSLAGAPVSGRATVGELMAVRRGVGLAQLATLPGNVSDRMIPDATSFTLDSKLGSQSHSTQGFLGFLSPRYQARVTPLLDTLEAIAKRIAPPAPPTPAPVVVKRAVFGIVQVKPNGITQIEENRSSILTVTNPPFQSILGKARNKNVSAYGNVLANPRAFGGTVELLWVQGYALRPGILHATPSDAAAPVATLRSNAVLKIVDEQVFGPPPILTTPPSFGQGDWLKVKLANGREGWLRAERVQVGEMFFPLRGAPRTPGAVSAVPQ